jgi:hypothetical protein
MQKIRYLNDLGWILNFPNQINTTISVVAAAWRSEIWDCVFGYNQPAEDQSVDQRWISCFLEGQDKINNVKSSSFLKSQ